MILWSADPATWISRLDALGYQQPPWSTFAIDTTTAPCAPVKNTVRDNRWCMVKAPPPAPPTGGCVDCPAGRFGYGDPVSGHWCCFPPPVAAHLQISAAWSRVARRSASTESTAVKGYSVAELTRAPATIYH